MNSFPNLDSLRNVTGTLERAGITSALGGSGLLASLGFAGKVRDWDLTTDEPLDRVRAALSGFEHQHVGNNGDHADDKLVLFGGEVEVIVRFALRSNAGIVRLATIVTERWNGVSVGSPEVWAVAYRMMGRTEKASLLFGLLERRGANPQVIAWLLAQPLPDEIRERLTLLERSDTSSTT